MVQVVPPSAEMPASTRLFNRSERSQTATAREASGVIASSTL